MEQDGVSGVVGLQAERRKRARNRNPTFQRKTMEKKSRREKRGKYLQNLIYCSKTIQRLQKHCSSILNLKQEKDRGL
jgi:hypothetical protein